MKNVLIFAISASAVLAMPFCAMAQTAMPMPMPMPMASGSMAMPAKAATMLCRPAATGEKPMAMMTDGKTGMVCKKLDPSMMMMKGKGGPDMSKVTSPQQADDAWRTYLMNMIVVQAGDA